MTERRAQPPRRKGSPTCLALADPSHRPRRRNRAGRGRSPWSRGRPIPMSLLPRGSGS